MAGAFCRGAFGAAHRHATESWGLLRAEFAEAASPNVVLCGIQADSLHAAVVALAARMLGCINELWDRNANAPLLPQATVYALGAALSHRPG